MHICNLALIKSSDKRKLIFVWLVRYNEYWPGTGVRLRRTKHVLTCIVNCVNDCSQSTSLRRCSPSHTTHGLRTAVMNPLLARYVTASHVRMSSLYGDLTRVDHQLYYLRQWGSAWLFTINIVFKGVPIIKATPQLFT